MGAAFTLARLIPIKKSILADGEKLTSLRLNADPRGAIPGFIDYFHIASHSRLSGVEWMVDFSQVTSLPNSQFPEILSRKILQMEDLDRVKFKIKLAAYQSRITDEEATAGLKEPWAVGH